MTAEWHYARGETTHGPVTEARLRELAATGDLLPTDRVWRKGTAGWVKAGTVPGLFPDDGPPPLPDAPSGLLATVQSHPLVRKVMSDKLLLLGCCLGLSVLLSFLIPSLLSPGKAPKMNFRFGQEDAEWEEYSRKSSRASAAAFALVVIDISLVTLIGVVAYRRFYSSAIDKMYDRGGPELPPNYPWPVEERSASNPKLLWMRVGIGASVVGGVLCLASVVGAIFCLPFFSAAILMYVLGIHKGRLHARWVPVEGHAGWVEFLAGGVFKREDGTVGTFALLPNQKFIDILASGHLVDSWKVLSWDQTHLEVLDMGGTPRSFKRGKTLAEKQMSLFHTERADHLPGSWLPADGSGEWVQFTGDGAVVYSDGRAGRYTVTGEDPNEVIRVKLADGSACEYRVMSLSKAQLVIVEGTQARAYHRQGHTGSAAADLTGEGVEPSKRAAEGEKAGVSVGSVLSGLWNRMTKWQCPACRSRNTEVRGSEITDRRQEVMSDVRPFERNFSQSVYNVTTHEHDCRCNGCGHEWIQEEITRTRA